MKHRRLVRTTLWAAAFAMCTSFAAAQDGKPNKVTKWVFQPCFDSSDAGWGSGVVPWIKAVEEATEGTVKIKLEHLERSTRIRSVRSDSRWVDRRTACWGSVYSGDMPEGMLAFGMAMGANNTQQAWDAMWGDPKYRIGDLIQEAAKERNLRWIGWTNQGPNAMFTKFPVRKMEDLAGKKDAGRRSPGPVPSGHGRRTRIHGWR